MIRGELDLELGKFNAKLAEAVNRSARAGEQMKRSTSGVGDSLGTAGNDLASAFGVGPLRSFSTWVGGIAAVGVGMKALLSDVDDLADRATRLNETPETLQRVEAAAKLSGGSVEGLSTAVLKLEKNLGEVENKGAAEALARYGLTAEKLAAMPLDEKILALSAAFQDARQSGRGYSDLLDLMGRGSADLIPLLSQTNDELKDLMGSVDTLSSAAVASMAAANDRVDLFLANMSTGAKKAAYDFMNLIEVMIEAGKHGSFQAGFDKIAQREMEALAKQDRLKGDKASQGAGIAEAKAAADAKAAEKAAADKAKADDATLDKAKDKLAGRQMAGMSGADKLSAMGEELQAVFDEMHQKGGLFFDQTTEGLAKWAASLEKSGHKELAAEVLGMQEKALGLQQEMGKISSGMREEAVKEAKDKEDKLTKARDDSAERETRLLSPEAAAEQMRGELSKSLGLTITSGADVNTGLAKLKAEAERARDGDDKDAELKARERYNTALDQASQLAGLSESPQRAALAGETAGAIGLLMGRSGNDLVLDESKKQGQTLDRIQRVLENIERQGKVAPDGFGIDFS